MSNGEHCRTLSRLSSGMKQNGQGRVLEVRDSKLTPQRENGTLDKELDSAPHRRLYSAPPPFLTSNSYLFSPGFNRPQQESWQLCSPTGSERCFKSYLGSLGEQQSNFRIIVVAGSLQRGLACLRKDTGKAGDKGTLGVGSSSLHHTQAEATPPEPQCLSGAHGQGSLKPLSLRWWDKEGCKHKEDRGVHFC